MRATFPAPVEKGSALAAKPPGHSLGAVVVLERVGRCSPSECAVWDSDILEEQRGCALPALGALACTVLGVVVSDKGEARGT